VYSVIINVLDVQETPTPPENRAPTMIMLAGVQVFENADNGTMVGQLSAHDPDGDVLTFTLLDDADGRFAIQDGRVVVADGTKLNYEAASLHQIKVLVSDGRGGEKEAVFTIRVRDVAEEPEVSIGRNVVLSNDTVSENTANLTVVGSLEVAEMILDGIQYELLDNAGGRFALDGDKVVVADGARLDHETGQSHSIRVRVTDATGYSLVKTLTIHVADEDEGGEQPPPPPENHAPTDIVISDNSVVENSENGTVVSVLIGKDPDGDNLAYTLVDNAGGRFAIVDDELVVADGTKLDHETAQSHTVRIRVTDSHGESLEKTFTIAVEDEEEETIPGTGGNDTLVGGSGNDILSGEAGSDVLTGGTGDDSLLGGRGNDRLFGGQGKDVISGGLGKDVLTGGAGKDTFVFDVAPTQANVDRISDFSVRDDTIQLTKAVFKTIGKTGVLAKAAFWTGTEAHDASDRIIYNANNGKLYYDADGTGAKAAVQIATLNRGLAITEKDFFIV
jgi:Ca2+-binding RTX toxin-like protein